MAGSVNIKATSIFIIRNVIVFADSYGIIPAEPACKVDILTAPGAKRHIFWACWPSAVLAFPHIVHQ